MSIRKALKWGLPLLVIAGCIASNWTWVKGADAEIDLDDQRQQLYETNRKIEEYQNQIFRIKKKKNSLVEELEYLDEELARSERQLEDAQFRLKQAELNLSKTQEDMQRTLEGLAEARRVSSKRLVAVYKKGNLSYMEILLSGVENYSDFVGRLYYMRRLTESDRRVMERIQEESARLSVQRAEHARRMAEISTQKQRISYKKLETETKRKDKEAAKKEFEQKLDSYESAYEDFLAESRELQSLIQKYAITAEGADLGDELGRLMRPVPGPVRSGFGMRFHPILRKKKMHTGVDLAAASGDSIFAAARGVVIFSGYKRGYGYTVILQHAANYQTLYAHCSALHVSEGQAVEQGAVIANIGATGLATGPHLHFELRYNGTPIDPQIK